ncbi:MAG: hypothetical protein FJ098_11970, partial [Deltaproteobacteria bacterium]|nr:hypothetical protein [Deltaproteobacteria bacterium]
VDPRSAAGLSRLRQVLLAALGLLALGAASLPYLLAQEGSLTRVAGMAALFSLVLNLCPFARSDGSLLLEALLGVPWLRGRTLRYLRQGLASQLRTWRTPSREERRLLGVLVLWAAWCALALPLLVFPAVIAALDATSGLLSMAVSADDALLSMAGLLLGLGLAAVFCLTSVFSVFLAASVTLRTLRTFLPPGTGRPAAADLPALEVALASAGLPRDSAPALAASGRWVSLGPEDEYPGRRGNGSMPLALLVRGKARVRRTEVSGMEHDVAEAAAGWIVPGGAAWRWSLRGTAETLLLVVDEVPPSSEVLAGRARLISSLEACSALWALGPDALRILAALPVLDVPAGADPGLKPEVLAVLLSGKLAAEGLTAPRVLPREAAGVPADAPSRLLILPPPGPGTFLPWGWRKAP